MSFLIGIGLRKWIGVPTSLYLPAPLVLGKYHNLIDFFLPNLRFRAQGEYAYCQVVREMQRSKTDFRVVALSATPGTDINAVRLMLQNLLISNIELRSEDSPDIVPYTFQRTIEKIVVPMGKELEDVRQKFLTILEVRNMYRVYQIP